jgi:hypothetical protein
MAVSLLLSDATSLCDALQDAFCVRRRVSPRIDDPVSPSGNKAIDSPIRF